MHVVVLGAGYAGVTLTRALERKLPGDATLTLVNESPDHLLQHELHRVIRRPGLANEITVSLPSVFDRASVRVATVEEIDRETRTITCSNGEISYDVAAVCLGAETAYYGLEGVREHSTPLKRLGHATTIRRNFFDALEANDPRVVVGGAGLSGVQVAGELAALADEEDADASITLLEQYDDVAPNFPENFQRAIRNALESAGIDVRTGTTVTDADSSAVHLERAASLPYDQFVWTGGVRGSGPMDGDRPSVESDLRVDDRTFAVGDAATVIDADGEPVPASAQSAVREARTAAENVSRVVSAELRSEEVEPDLEEFSFSSPGWVATVGEETVAQIGPTVVTGRAAAAVKASVGAGYLSSMGSVRNAIGLAGSELRW